MSIPTPGSDSQSLMSSGLEMLQAPQSLKDIVGFVKPYTPPEEPVDVEALMAERALLDQERFTQMLIDLGYMKPPAPEYIDNPLGMDIRPPSGLSGPSTDVMNPPKPSFYEKYINPMFEFFGPGDDFEIGGNTIKPGLSSGGTPDDKVKEYKRLHNMAQLGLFGLESVPMDLIYNLLGVSGLFSEGGPVYGSLGEAIADQKAEELIQNSEMFRSRMDPPPLRILPEDLSEEMLVEPFEETPLGVGGTITDDMFTANYGMPVGTGGMSGQLTVPFESDPTLQLLLEQQLADDLSLNAGVNLMAPNDEAFFRLLYNF